jgi:hypothetical protein
MNAAPKTVIAFRFMVLLLRFWFPAETSVRAPGGRERFCTSGGNCHASGAQLPRAVIAG